MALLAITPDPEVDTVVVIIELITLAAQYDSSVIIVSPETALHLKVPPNLVPVDKCRQTFKPVTDPVKVYKWRMSIK